MSEVFIVGVDLAKRVIQVHGATATGNVLFRKKLSRVRFAKFLGDLPACIVAMEACASAHYWGREAQLAGHEVRLVPAAYVKPFVKRHKSDVVDAEAISEAALRPSMRFVPVKTPEQQSQGMLFRTREMFVRQRTQTINAIRAHLAEFGIVLRLRIRNPDTFAHEIEERAAALPELAQSLADRLLEQISTIISVHISALDMEIKAHARSSLDANLMQTMPGVGPMSAMAVEAFCPPAKTFEAAATLLLGCVLFPDSIRPEAKSGSVGSQRWAKRMCGDC